MNFKLLFPTYRTRERFVREVLEGLGPKPLGRMVNIGAGEGDIDAALASFASELESCDVNPEDVAHARKMNASVQNVRYSVQDGGALTWGDAEFDVVVCLEVIEHVPDPRQLLAEIVRVVRPGGSVILTCPSVKFPVTYDPINAILAPRRRHLSVGAYGFGHSWLVDDEELESWCAQAGLSVRIKRRMSGALVGALECYWPSVLQRVFKANAGNTETRSGSAELRPTATKPPLLRAIDTLIAIDRKTSVTSSRSIGLGYLLRRD